MTKEKISCYKRDLFKMDKKITIERLFNLQDKCYLKNKESIVDKCHFVEECIELMCNRIISGEFTEGEKEKFKIIHQFLDTALSSLINAYKLLLYGCTGDSFALLRVVFEATVFQDYAVVFNDYEKVKEEVIIKAGEEDRFKFKEALRKLEKECDTDRGKLFGFLSSLGSHLTSDRMQYNYFKINGKIFPITCHAILEKKFLEQVINIQMQLALYMINVLVEFYQKTKPDAAREDFFKQAGLLNKKYKDF